jgi:hypothetical protein
MIGYILEEQGIAEVIHKIILKGERKTSVTTTEEKFIKLYVKIIY